MIEARIQQMSDDQMMEIYTSQLDELTQKQVLCRSITEGVSVEDSCRRTLLAGARVLQPRPRFKIVK